MKKQSAFTLVEILVVILISLVLLSVTLLSMRDTSVNYLLRDDVARLSALLERNCQEALAYGQQIGIRVGPEGYQSYRFENGQWQDMSSESVIYRHKNWSADWQIDLSFQGRDTSLSDARELPQLICLDSGELLPFELSFDGGSRNTQVLTGHANGQLEIEGSQ